MRSAAIVVFAMLTAATLLVAWRAPAATGAVALAAAFVGLVFLEWAVRANPDMLVWPGGPLPGIGPSANRQLHFVAFGRWPHYSPSASAAPDFSRKAAARMRWCR